jgi:hypothetical protein
LFTKRAAGINGSFLHAKSRPSTEITLSQSSLRFATCELAVLEILDGTFMRLGSFLRTECAEIAATPGFRILFA